MEWGRSWDGKQGDEMGRKGRGAWLYMDQRGPIFPSHNRLSCDRDPQSGSVEEAFCWGLESVERGLGENIL